MTWPATAWDAATGLPRLPFHHVSWQLRRIRPSGSARRCLVITTPPDTFQQKLVLIGALIVAAYVLVELATRPLAESLVPAVLMFMAGCAWYWLRPHEIFYRLRIHELLLSREGLTLRAPGRWRFVPWASVVDVEMGKDEDSYLVLRLTADAMVEQYPSPAWLERKPRRIALEEVGKQGGETIARLLMTYLVDASRRDALDEPWATDGLWSAPLDAHRPRLSATSWTPVSDAGATSHARLSRAASLLLAIPGIGLLALAVQVASLPYPTEILPWIAALVGAPAGLLLLSAWGVWRDTAWGWVLASISSLVPLTLLMIIGRALGVPSGPWWLMTAWCAAVLVPVALRLRSLVMQRDLP